MSLTEGSSVHDDDTNLHTGRSSNNCIGAIQTGNNDLTMKRGVWTVWTDNSMILIVILISIYT